MKIRCLYDLDRLMIMEGSTLVTLYTTRVKYCPS